MILLFGVQFYTFCFFFFFPLSIQYVAFDIVQVEFCNFNFGELRGPDTFWETSMTEGLVGGWLGICLVYFSATNTCRAVLVSTFIGA